MVSTNLTPTTETRTKKTLITSLIILSSSLVILIIGAASYVNVDDGNNDNILIPIKNVLKSRVLKMYETMTSGNNHITTKRIAIVRPFSMNDYQEMMSSFDDWDKFPPCDNEFEDQTTTTTTPPVVDLILSFSQTFSSQPDVTKSIDDFKNRLSDARWPACFDNVYTYEARIPIEKDIYEPSRAQKDVMWVNGPNRHFESIFRFVEGEGYDSLFLMEADNILNKKYWMDRLLWEADEKSPFAILGSKYDGDKWDSFRDKIPISLLHHINGNALYNINHPYLKLIIAQLESEASSEYNSVAFDYRISQIIHEGSHGIVHDTLFAQDNTANIQKFTEWWMEYGKDDPIKESQVVSNLAATNLLPEQVKDATILHGAHLYAPWNSQLHEITLVVSEWEDKKSDETLLGLESSRHPFSKVSLIVPGGFSTDAPKTMVHTYDTLKVSVFERKGSFSLELCRAPVSTEWFMMTNSHHKPTASIDLLFTSDEDHKPVIPILSADDASCVNLEECQQLLSSAKMMYPETNVIVQDSDMLFHTPDRDEFCNEWADKYSRVASPTATAYIAYLFSKGKANDLYDFTDRRMFGSSQHYIKIFGEEKETDETPREIQQSRVLALPVSSPVTKPSTPPPPTSPPDVKGCVCQYIDTPKCRRSKKKKCQKNKKTCAWFKNQCVSITHMKCMEWSTDQDNCDQISTLPYVPPGDPTYDLTTAVTTFRYQFEGENRRCTNVIDRVVTAIQKLPNGKTFHIIDNGCVTFRPHYTRKTELERIKYHLNPGVTVTLSSHHCLTTRYCHNRIITTITSAAITDTYAMMTCGSDCNRGRQSFYCKNSRGFVVRGRCKLKADKSKAACIGKKRFCRVGCCELKTPRLKMKHKHKAKD